MLINGLLEDVKKEVREIRESMPRWTGLLKARQQNVELNCKAKANKCHEAVLCIVNEIEALAESRLPKWNGKSAFQLVVGLQKAMNAHIVQQERNRQALTDIQAQIRHPEHNAKLRLYQIASELKYVGCPCAVRDLH